MKTVKKASSARPKDILFSDFYFFKLCLALSNNKKNFATNVATEVSLSPHMSKFFLNKIFTWKYDKGDMKYYALPFKKL